MKRNRFIYVCSPLRGDIETNIAKAKGYCREIVEMWPNVVPIAPHIYCTQFLDDEKPAERAAGMDIGLALLDMCDEIWIYATLELSEGMKAEIEYARAHKIPIKYISEVYREHKLGKNAAENEPGLVCIKAKSPAYSRICVRGELIVDLAKRIRRSPGKNFTWEV